MLELRPVCENCGVDLPNGNTNAMICSFECTFCRNCVDQLLKNVCPNCGGGFEKRPIRPTECLTNNCIDKFPATTIRKIVPVDLLKLKILHKHFLTVPPHDR